MNTGHNFTVNKVAFSSDVDSFVNIQKKRVDINYRSSTSSSVVNLAFVQSTETSSSNNLSVNDRSTSLPENRVNAQLVDQILDGIAGFTIETDQFLVTDVFTDAISTQIPLPLFYQHTLSYTLGVGEIIADLKLLDIDFREVNISELKIDGSVIYNNLTNTYDQDTGIAELYYVSYLVRKADATLERYIEMVSNTKIFRQAEVGDLDGFGNILPGVKAYILQQDIGANFSVILPTLDDYGLRRLAESRLQLVEPSDTSTADPWFVSIQNGQFLASVLTSVGNYTPFKYYIAEFSNQNFNPFFPYKLQAGEESFRVSRRVVKTIRSDLITDPAENLYVDVIVYREDGTAKFALTSDPSKLGTAAVGSTLYSNVLLGDPKTSGVDINDSGRPIAGSSIDALHGFIVLPAGYETLETDIIKSSYFYREDKYEISFFDLNPLSNADILRQRLVIFVKPEELALTFTQTVFWLLVNEDGQVVDTNWDTVLNGALGTFGTGDLEDALTEGLLWFDRPSAENPALTRSPSWAPDNSVDFVKNFSVEGDPNPYGYLILGEVNVKEAVRVSSAVVNDIRIRGGGISEELEEASVDIQPEAIWYWDLKFWDGYPYPGAASYFVDVPVDILEDCGGRFSPKQVQEIVHRHTAAGVYPVVHKYNVYEPVITNIVYQEQAMTISWSQGPTDAAYQVYSSNVEEGPYTALSEVFYNNINGNSAELVLTGGEIQYLIVVGRQELDGIVCFSGPINIEDPGLVPDFTVANANERISHQVEVT